MAAWMPSAFCSACGLYSLRVFPKAAEKAATVRSSAGPPMDPPDGLAEHSGCAPLCATDTCLGDKSSNFNVLLRRNQHQKRPTVKTGKRHTLGNLPKTKTHGRSYKEMWTHLVPHFGQERWGREPAAAFFGELRRSMCRCLGKS